MTILVNSVVSGGGDNDPGSPLVYTTSAPGTSPSGAKPSGYGKVIVGVTGSVNYAAIYVENADAPNDIYGAFGAPMSGVRACTVPSGAINIQARVAAFDGTSITATLAAGV